jgi:Protein of unknown function (DUF1571)
MFKLKFLLLASLCLGAAWAFMESLTGPQHMPPAGRRMPVGGDLGAVWADAAPVASSSTTVSPAAKTPIDEYRAMLNQSEEYLRSVDGYTGTFIQQVRKEDELRDREEISIKLRHQPFSVYMNWDSGAQQVLYVEGENDGRLLARRTRGFFRRTIKMAPTSRLAMLNTRYPVYDLGMLKLVEKAQAALAACTSYSGIHCCVETTDLDGQPVRQFTITFDSPDVQATYARCVLCFEEESPMLVCITNYGWTATGEPGELLEHYHYCNLQIAPGLTDVDFDPENEQYGF